MGLGLGLKLGLGKGGGVRALLQYIGGTLADPIDAGSTLNKTNTWVQMQSLPIASTLKEFKAYCTAAGSLKMKVLQPVSGGSFNVISNQTLTCAIGLNTFSVEAGTLAEVSMPANSLVGLHTPSSGGATVSFKSGESPFYSAGYMAGSGDLSGNGAILGSAASYANELQTKFTATFRRANAPSGVHISESFAGTLLPAFAVNNATTPWTFTAGKATSAGTGLASFLDFFPTTNADRNTWSVSFEFKAAGDRFCIYRKPILGDTSAAEGTIGEADLDNNWIIIYQTWAGGTTYTLPLAQETKVLSNLTLATGVVYRLDLVKAAKTMTLTITDTVTSDTESVSVDNDPTNLSGLGYGRPGFASLAGVIDVKSAQLYSAVPNPKLIILGDSITEGSGTDVETSYAQLSLDYAAGNGWYSGDGGTLAANCLRRLRHDLRLCVPKYVVVYIGANNANSDANTTAFATDIQNIYDTITNAGATPVICTLTPNSDATQNGRVQTMNGVLLGKGWTLARFDTALSVGGDGSTYNAALMADGVHPNTAGHLALFNRLKLDYPQIF